MKSSTMASDSSAGAMASMRVFSRNGRDWSDRVPLIVEALRALPMSSATIDGEGVVCDERGITDFDRLRSTWSGAAARARCSSMPSP